MDAPEGKELANKALGKWLHQKTGIPLKIIHGIDKADDWTFVITLHAMLESVLNNLILKKLGFPELREIIAHFDTGDRQKGKLMWAKVLGLLPEKSRAFIRILSKVRNDIVHNVSAFGFSFSEWIEKLPKADFKNLKDSYSDSLKERFTWKGELVSRDDALMKHPRDMIFAGAIIIIVMAHSDELLKPSAVSDQSTPKE